MGGAAGGVVAAGYLGLVTGACPIDVNLGRRSRPLGPLVVDIAAARELVFDIIAQPYLGRTTHAMAEKVRVLDAAPIWCWPPTAPPSAARSAAG
jgi:hypothetical protein